MLSMPGTGISIRKRNSLNSDPMKFSRANNRCHSLIHLPPLVMMLFLFFNANKTLATEVDSVTARIVARHFYQSALRDVTSETVKKSTAEIELELVHQEYAGSFNRNPDLEMIEGHPLYFVFNVKGDRGFIIVSGNERVKPILSYAFKGAYKKSHQPPAFQAWMTNYKTQILSILEKNTREDIQTLNEWKKYKERARFEEKAQSSKMNPLVTTRWNQGCCYNGCCPIDTSCPCNRVSAGCAAVAMAQIIRYWEHPGKCNAIPGYMDEANLDPNWLEIPNSDYGWIEDIKPTSYDWSIMPDALNDSSGMYEIDEVSKLIFHCGVSVEMNYGPHGSDAYGVDIPSALSTCFNYNSHLQYVSRHKYCDDAWENLLRFELDNGRPVLYMGSGHAFVCDGYQGAGYFHFNWGWGGIHDAYFYLDDLTPGSNNHTGSQRAIIKIYPEYQEKSPCENIISISSYGFNHIQTFQGGSKGSWSNSTCGWSTPGSEQIYSFVSPISGIFSLIVTDANGYIDCAWKESNCGKLGWNCIGDINTAGRYGAMAFKEGETYFILLDDEDTTTGDFQFYIEPQVSTSSSLTQNPNNIRIFPNPISDLLFIEADQALHLSIEIRSANGLIIFRKVNIGTPCQLDLSSVPTGIHYINISSKDFVFTRKIIKL